HPTGPMAHGLQGRERTAKGGVVNGFCLTLEVGSRHLPGREIPYPEPAMVIDLGPAILVACILATAANLPVQPRRLLLVTAPLGLLNRFLGFPV
ncbi:hypothetical protein, partial [Enterococcus faecium]|uniref:hypothetical protein n=1 Tax=Enterococcus faecium TaxID=1352 RepID=UPI0039E0E01A